MNWIMANLMNASDDRTVRSRSVLNRRHFPNHANVRSTVYRIGNFTQPFASSGRRTITNSHEAFAFTQS